MPATTLIVEFGFGYGANETVGAWTDVTQYVRQQDAVVIQRGRTAIIEGITPGTASFTLDNTSGRFTASNTASPYFGNLKAKVPVRIRQTYSGNTQTIFRGFTNSPWSSEITGPDSVVRVECMDALGLVSQSQVPPTAFDAAVRTLTTQPNQWWRPGLDGWIDSAGGLLGVHTSQLVEFSPTVDGEERSFGQSEPDGYGLITNSSAFINPDTANTIVLSFWIRMASAESQALMPDPLGGTDMPIIFQTRTPTTAGSEVAALTVTLNNSGLNVTVGCPSWKTEGDGYQTVAINLSELNISYEPGTVHHFQVSIKRPTTSGWMATPNLQPIVDGVGGTPLATGGRIRVWIDGYEITGYGLANLTSTFLGVTGPLKIGASSPAWSVYVAPKYVGAIDHLMVWNAHPGNDAALDTQALALYEAGVLAWAGDRMDQRLARIISSVGLAGYLGTIDVSGITTKQGYRSGAPLTLLQNIENTEQGRVWCDRNGLIRFSKRTWAWDDTVSNTVQQTFGMTGSEIRYLNDNLVVGADSRKVINYAAVNSTFGRQQVVEDAASQDDYGVQPIQLSNLLHSSDRASRSIAEWLIDMYSQPTQRVEKLSFNVETNPSVNAPLAQTVDEGWLFRFKHTPKSGDALNLLAHVTGVVHTIDSFGWNVTLFLDTSRASSTFFKWGTSNWGGANGWAF